VHTQVFLGLATTRDPRRMGLTACLAQGLWVQTQVSWVWQACQTYHDWVGQVCQTMFFESSNLSYLKLACLKLKKKKHDCPNQYQMQKFIHNPLNPTKSKRNN
jgi:hypothetical protein